MSLKLLKKPDLDDYKVIKHTRSRFRRKRPREDEPAYPVKKDQHNYLIYLQNLLPTETDQQVRQLAGDAAAEAKINVHADKIAARALHSTGFPVNYELTRPIGANDPGAELLTEFDELIDYAQALTQWADDVEKGNLLSNDAIEALGEIRKFGWGFFNLISGPYKDRINLATQSILPFVKLFFQIRARAWTVLVRNDPLLEWTDARVQDEADDVRIRGNDITHGSRLEDDLITLEAMKMTNRQNALNPAFEECFEAQYWMTTQEAVQLFRRATTTDPNILGHDKRTPAAKYFTWAIRIINAYTKWKTEVLGTLQAISEFELIRREWTRQGSGHECDRAFGWFIEAVVSHINSSEADAGERVNWLFPCTNLVNAVQYVNIQGLGIFMSMGLPRRQKDIEFSLRRFVGVADVLVQRVEPLNFDFNLLPERLAGVVVPPPGTAPPRTPPDLGRRIRNKRGARIPPPNGYNCTTPNGYDPNNTTLALPMPRKHYPRERR